MYSALAKYFLSSPLTFAIEPVRAYSGASTRAIALCPSAETPSITKERSTDTRCLCGDILMSAHLLKNKMITTVQQLIEKLQQFPADSVVTVTTAADDQEFLIIELKSEDKSVSIIVGESVDDEPEEEGE